METVGLLDKNTASAMMNIDRLFSETLILLTRDIVSLAITVGRCSRDAHC